jgi:hypothetical protein
VSPLLLVVVLVVLVLLPLPFFGASADVGKWCCF